MVGADGRESPSQAGLAAAPIEEPWEPLGLQTRSPTFHLLFLAHSRPLPPLGAWVSLTALGANSRARAGRSSLRAIGMSWSLPKMTPFPKMTPSQQWKEEPISQQRRGWGGGRWEWSPGPLCGADKVRKLRLEWEEAQRRGPFPRVGASGTA